MISNRFAVKSDRHLGYHLSRLRRCFARKNRIGSGSAELAEVLALPLDLSFHLQSFTNALRV